MQGLDVGDTENDFAHAVICAGEADRFRSDFEDAGSRGSALGAPIACSLGLNSNHAAAEDKCQTRQTH